MMCIRLIFCHQQDTCQLQTSLPSLMLLSDLSPRCAAYNKSIFLKPYITFTVALKVLINLI